MFSIGSFELADAVSDIHHPARSDVSVQLPNFFNIFKLYNFGYVSPIKRQLNKFDVLMRSKLFGRIFIILFLKFQKY